jgi:hypothetical protein
MKMAKETFEKIKAGIEPLLTADRIARYETGDFKTSEKTKDLNVRFRWDMFWLARSIARQSGDDWAPLLADLLDEHIDTALRRIVPPIERSY